MTDEYWLDDRAWAAIEPLLPRNRAGARRVDDRRVISGIVLRSGCRWKDCPAVYGPHTTIYNRWNRWSAQGLWTRLFQALADAGPAEVAMIDSSAVKASRAVGDAWSFDRSPRLITRCWGTIGLTHHASEAT